MPSGDEERISLKLFLLVAIGGLGCAAFVVTVIALWSAAVFGAVLLLDKTGVRVDYDFILYAVSTGFIYAILRFIFGTGKVVDSAATTDEDQKDLRILYRAFAVEVPCQLLLMKFRSLVPLSVPLPIIVTLARGVQFDAFQQFYAGLTTTQKRAQTVFSVLVYSLYIYAVVLRSVTLSAFTTLFAVIVLMTVVIYSFGRRVSPLPFLLNVSLYTRAVAASIFALTVLRPYESVNAMDTYWDAVDLIILAKGAVIESFAGSIVQAILGLEVLEFVAVHVVSRRAAMAIFPSASDSKSKSE